MTQSSHVLYNFLAFGEAERQKRIDLYGGTGGKRGVVVFCFVHAGTPYLNN